MERAARAAREFGDANDAVDRSAAGHFGINRTDFRIGHTTAELDLISDLLPRDLLPRGRALQLAVAARIAGRC